MKSEIGRVVLRVMIPRILEEAFPSARRLHDLAEDVRDFLDSSTTTALFRAFEDVVIDHEGSIPDKGEDPPLRLAMRNQMIVLSGIYDAIRLALRGVQMSDDEAFYAARLLILDAMKLVRAERPS